MEAVKVNILVDSVNKVKGFVNIMYKSQHDVDLKSGNYVVDAKSIMGVFSLDVSHPVELTIHGNDANTENILDELKSGGYIAD